MGKGTERTKGMGIFKNKLYIADLTEVVIVNTKRAALIKKVPIPETVFFNDIAVDGRGIVYVSDTQKTKFTGLSMMFPNYISTVSTAPTDLPFAETDLYILAGKELWKLDKNKNKTIIASGLE